VSAAAALARAEAAGLRLWLSPDGKVRMEASAPPPPDLLADLRRWREDVSRLIAQRDARSMPTLAAELVPASGAGDWRALPFGPERGAAFLSARTAAGACHACAGLRWWRGEGEQAALRCIVCHPPPPRLSITVSNA
jgi:hypothetical protein